MRIAFGSYNHAIQQGHSLFWVNYSKYNWYVKFLVFLLYNIVGIVVYHRYEDWSILYCIYFITVVSLSTESFIKPSELEFLNQQFIGLHHCWLWTHDTHK